MNRNKGNISRELKRNTNNLTHGTGQTAWN